MVNERLTARAHLLLMEKAAGLPDLTPFVEVPRLTPEELARAPEGEPSAVVRERVLAARERMKARQGKLNSEPLGHALRQHTALSAASEALLQAATRRLALTARTLENLVRIAAR